MEYIATNFFKVSKEYTGDDQERLKNEYSWIDEISSFTLSHGDVSASGVFISFLVEDNNDEQEKLNILSSSI